MHKPVHSPILWVLVVSPGTPISPASPGPEIQPTDAPFRSTTETAINAATTGTTFIASSTLPPGIITSGINDGVPPIITTAFDIQAATLTSVDPTITEDTAISTGDATHPWGLYPFFNGGSRCLWCPPGLDNGGLVLWGITKPGVSSFKREFDFNDDDLQHPRNTTIYSLRFPT